MSRMAGSIVSLPMQTRTVFISEITDSLVACLLLKTNVDASGQLNGP